MKTTETEMTKYFLFILNRKDGFSRSVEFLSKSSYHARIACETLILGENESLMCVVPSSRIDWRVQL